MEINLSVALQRTTTEPVHDSRSWARLWHAACNTLYLWLVAIAYCYEERFMRPGVLVTVATTLLLAAAETKEDAVKKEWAALEGTWTLIKMEANGKSLLKKGERSPQLMIQDGKISAKGAPKHVAADAPVPRLDPTRKPKWITIPNVKGGKPEEGVTAIGIYQRKGNVLRVCVQLVETARLKERSKERPTAFNSTQGLLLVFKRQEK